MFELSERVVARAIDEYMRKTRSIQVELTARKLASLSPFLRKYVVKESGYYSSARLVKVSELMPKALELLKNKVVYEKKIQVIKRSKSRRKKVIWVVEKRIKEVEVSPITVDILALPVSTVGEPRIICDTKIQVVLKTAYGEPHYLVLGSDFRVYDQENRLKLIDIHAGGLTKLAAQQLADFFAATVEKLAEKYGLEYRAKAVLRHRQYKWYGITVKAYAESEKQIVREHAVELLSECDIVSEEGF